MIGGLAREAPKQPIIRMKRLRVKVKNWGGESPPRPPPPPPPSGSAALGEEPILYCPGQAPIPTQAPTPQLVLCFYF